MHGLSPHEVHGQAEDHKPEWWVDNMYCKFAHALSTLLQDNLISELQAPCIGKRPPTRPCQIDRSVCRLQACDIPLPAMWIYERHQQWLGRVLLAAACMHANCVCTWLRGRHSAQDNDGSLNLI